MPWRVRRQLYMILLGAAALGLGIVVQVRDRSVDTRLLAAGLILGGVAIILNVLPANGDGKE